MYPEYQRNYNHEDQSVTLTPIQPKYSLIWLHGLGDTNRGFQDLFKDQISPLYKGGRIKLLQAPYRSVTVNKGRRMPSWYDIKSLAFESTQEDEHQKYGIDQIKQSLQEINRHVKMEQEYWKDKNKQDDPNKRIFIGGLSQGCAISLLYCLTCQYKLAGFVGASGHCFKSFKFVSLQNLPILLFHGKNDELIKFQKAKQSYGQILKRENTSFIELDIGHTFADQQLVQMTKWLEKQISRTK